MRRGEIAGLRWGAWNVVSTNCRSAVPVKRSPDVRPSSPPRRAPVDAASKWTPTPNTSSTAGAIANVKTGIALGRATRCSPTLTSSRYTRSRSANCSPGSLRVRDCLTSGSTNTPTHARSPVRRPRQTGRRRIRSFDRECPSSPAMRAANSRADVNRTGRGTVRRTLRPNTRNARKPNVSGHFYQWRGPDLNQRPSGYEPDELPSCSTPR